MIGLSKTRLKGKDERGKGDHWMLGSVIEKMLVWKYVEEYKSTSLSLL